MDSNSVKQNIRKVRKDMGLTQKEMADKLGISRTAYRNLEKGETKVYSNHISRMAELSGKAEEEVVLGYTPRQADEDTLREIQNYEEKISSLTEYYESRISDLNEKLKDREKLIESLQNNVRTLQSMVDLMSRQS
ncbi:MAG: helix-turn-helix domain-containing protein [Bacteroidales bacterium]|nr:helix-turn-helix domain-containing protein [Bacteroidales bacterium]